MVLDKKIHPKRAERNRMKTSFHRRERDSCSRGQRNRSKKKKKSVIDAERRCQKEKRDESSTDKKGGCLALTLTDEHGKLRACKERVTDNVGQLSRVSSKGKE